MTTVADLAGAVLGPLDRLAAALVDPSRRERTAVRLLIGYVAVWTLYGVLAKGSQDVHFDMGEAVAWSREPAFGYSKHPPLSLVPFFNFHALKFNANTVLIPLWAATTLWFLRSFETRDLLSAALAGVAAAAAMLGKYWSIVLLGGLAIAALGDARRSGYFRSPAPWVTVAAGALALAPHLAWLLTQGAAPFEYALDKHPAPSFLDAILGSLSFLAGGAAYIAAPIVLAATATLPSAAAILETLWPATAHRRIAAAAFWAPLLLAILLGLAAQVLISSLWIMSAVTLLPVVLMSSPLVGMRRGALPLLLGVAIAVPVLATLAAPAIAYVIHRKGVPHHAQRYRLVAEAVDRAWRATTTQPMGLVGSDTALGNGVAFYLSDRPSTLDVLDPRRTPWANEARIARQGIALVCAVEETDCMNAVAALASGLSRGKRSEIELARNYLGAAGKPERYWIITVPPQF